MWKIKVKFSKHLPIIGISIAFIIPGIGLFLSGGCMGVIMGWVFIAIGLIVFFVMLMWPLRNEIPPLDVSVRESKIVWGLWFTGDMITEQHLLEKYRSIKRVLLLDPTSDGFKEHIRKSINTEEKAGGQIKRFTRLAREGGVEVRWYSKEQEIGLMLCDPQEGSEPSSDKAWCVFEKHYPDVLREQRPRTMVRKANNDTQFNLLREMYEDIWNCAREPKPEEY